MRTAYIDNYIARSHMLPLDVHFSFAQSSSNFRKDIADLFKRMRPSMKRWRSLSVVESDSTNLYSILSKCVIAASSLEETSSSVTDYPYSVDETDEWVLDKLDEFEPTPNLRKITFGKLHTVPFEVLLTPLSDPLEPPSLPWLSSLTSLSITDRDGGDDDPRGRCDRASRL